MKSIDYRLCVAPMMAWTDRHCRYFHRLLAPHAHLYTEMVTANALRYGDAQRHLAFDRAESPLALQLGGSEPDELAHAARLGEDYGYDEINLNCGCPSERVQRGAFGACLMQEPELVADCVTAMREAVALPVTVKHRIGVNQSEEYDFVATFIDKVARAGCDTFIVHARNAWLSGLSPKENREIPPLRYEVVRRLKADFPLFTFVINGGIDSLPAADAQATGLDGVMIGRAAYQQPYLLAEIESAWFGTPLPQRAQIVLQMAQYVEDYLKRDPRAELRHVVRHLLGLYHGKPAARRWRRILSDASRLKGADASLLIEALAEVEPGSSQSILPGFINPKGSSAVLM